MDPVTTNLDHIQVVVNTLVHDVEKLRSDVRLAKLVAPAQPVNVTNPGLTNQRERTPPSELEARHKRYQYILDRTRSLPKNQFLDLVQEEMQRIWQDDPRSVNHPKLPRYMMTKRLRDQAARIIKDQWVEQGIWQRSFEGLLTQQHLNVGVWKHQELVPFDDDYIQKFPNTAARRLRERDASRPCHQFQHQVEEVRDRLLDQWWQSLDEKDKKRRKKKKKTGTNTTTATTTTTSTERVTIRTLPPAEIDSQAYHEVRQAWTKRRIWDLSWEVLPGQHWRHERPLEELLTPQEARWYAEMEKTTWGVVVRGSVAVAEPPPAGPSGPHRLVHRVEAERGVLEVFERRHGGPLRFSPDGLVEPRRGRKRKRLPWHSDGSSSSDDDHDDDDDDDVSEDMEPVAKKRKVSELSSDSEVSDSSNQSSRKPRRKAYKSPFVWDDDE